MKELTKPLGKLPATAEGLRDYVLLAREKVQAYELVLKSLDRQGAKDVYDRTLSEAQIVAEHALLAEAKLGEMLAAVEHRGGSSTEGTSHPLPPGIDKRMSHRAQEVYRNPEAVAEVISRAKGRGEIPVHRDLTKVFRESKRAFHMETLRAQPWPEGRYRVIYADPPWKYGDTREGLTSATGATAGGALDRVRIRGYAGSDLPSEV